MPREPPVTSATLPLRSVRNRGAAAGLGMIDSRNESPPVVMTRPPRPCGRRLSRSVRGSDLLGLCPLLLEGQDLVTVVGATARTDVVGHLFLAALWAVHQLGQGQGEVMAAVAAIHAADLLLWQGSHDCCSF